MKSARPTADIYLESLSSILDACAVTLSDIRPSDWVEEHRIMSTAETALQQGPFRYDITPYCREIADCAADDHPARIISVMKGAQVGFSKGVIETIIGWAIAENPQNILHLTGHADLSEEAVANIDLMIDSCGIRHLIRSASSRSRKTGDTNTKKEFRGGQYISGSATNHKLMRQRSFSLGLIDDYEAVKAASAESGSTRKMIEQRFAASQDRMKLFYISTPEIRPSNIEEVYLLGDQRAYMVPCPCCGVFIKYEWSVDIKGAESKEKGGISFKVDDAGHLISGSVGYICQECGGFFTDQHKYERNLAGIWTPTAVPFQPDIYSYHLSSLYAAPGMYDWHHYVLDYLEANPAEGKRKERIHQTLVNLCWGLSYETAAAAPMATDLMKNVRPYEIGTIPEKLSLADGNGRIVLLTCTCDLNGTVEDARLDYEVIAWSETGATYSITHGSIGTFVPRESKTAPDREKWTYVNTSINNVWKDFDRIIDPYQTKFMTDSDQLRQMPVQITGVDTGHYTDYAYLYLDGCNRAIVALKGDKEKYSPMRDVRTFSVGKAHANLFMVQVGHVKDELAGYMKLKWNPDTDDSQPFGFMNFPQSAEGMYDYKNFFSHYEAEERAPVRGSQTGLSIWGKKSDQHQNHFWDIRVYHIALKDIFLDMIFKEYKVKNGTWADFVNAVLDR